MKRVLSGIQPTGNVHLGNYLGAIKNWIDLQNDHECFFGIMNLHAITLPQNPVELRQNVLNAAAIYLACGLDYKKSTIFVQSEISALSDISWVLSCQTPMGWLNRMTQFKEKGEKGGENLALFAYPVLMASDILSFHGDLVPVGEDQKQHLELTRDLAGVFNRIVKKDYFKLPKPLILKDVKRIMSLQDGSKKMSKSDESEISRINLSDDESVMRKKIMKAKTDSENFISYDENRKELYNLINIFAAFSGENPENIAKNYENSGYGKFKNDLAEILLEKLGKIKYTASKFLNEKTELEKILKEGSLKAAEVAENSKNEIFSLIGLK